MALRRAAIAAATLLALARPAAAQPQDPSRKWEIVDNSFLVEEAFNQERGVVQNIFTWVRERNGAWAANFTQEWPAPGVAHQLSYTLVQLDNGEARGVGDALLNYRYQLREETAGGPAIAPRVSVILPTGRTEDDLGAGRVGLQINVPASKQFGNFYLHANAGYTWLPSTQHLALVAGSAIWRATSMFNLMLEALVSFDESATVSPGFRRGWNFGDRQLVVGAAVPFTHVDGDTSAALLAYVSYELPFRR